MTSNRTERFVRNVLFPFGTNCLLCQNGPRRSFERHDVYWTTWRSEPAVLHPSPPCLCSPAVAFSALQPCCLGVFGGAKCVNWGCGVSGHRGRRGEMIIYCGPVWDVQSLSGKRVSGSEWWNRFVVHKRQEWCSININKHSMLTRTAEIGSWNVYHVCCAVFFSSPRWQDKMQSHCEQMSKPCNQQRTHWTSPLCWTYEQESLRSEHSQAQTGPQKEFKVRTDTQWCTSVDHYWKCTLLPRNSMSERHTFGTSDVPHMLDMTITIGQTPPKMCFLQVVFNAIVAWTMQGKFLLGSADCSYPWGANLGSKFARIATQKWHKYRVGKIRRRVSAAIRSWASPPHVRFAKVTCDNRKIHPTRVSCVFDGTSYVRNVARSQLTFEHGYVRCHFPYLLVGDTQRGPG